MNTNEKWNIMCDHCKEMLGTEYSEDIIKHIRQETIKELEEWAEHIGEHTLTTLRIVIEKLKEKN